MSRTKKLFLVGTARSGTTITHTVLNRSRHIYLYNEFQTPVIAAWPEFRKRHEGVHFVDGFLETKRKIGQTGKGYDDGTLREHGRIETPEQIFDVPQGFRYVGEKIALLHMKWVTATIPGYYAERFPDAHFLCLLRRPGPTFYSSLHHRRKSGFPLSSDTALKFLAAGMLATFEIACERPNARLLLFDQLSRPAFGRVQRWLGVGGISEVWEKFADPRRPKSYDEEFEREEPEVRDMLGRLDTWYDALLENWTSPGKPDPSLLAGAREALDI